MRGESSNTFKGNLLNCWEVQNGLSAAKLFIRRFLWRRELAISTEKDAKLVIDLLKSNKYTDKEISKITGFPVRSFIAKIRRKETWTYLTKDIDTLLGKAERKTFTYK